MFGQLPFDIMFLIMLYAAGTATATIACVYLLLRKGNAFDPDVKTPARLRRWTAVFFAVIALGHVWYLPPVMFTSDDAIMLSMQVGGLLDCLLTVPLAIVLLIYMVHEVRRYGRWLRDNYVDLEHKEVWQSFLVLAVILLVFSIYASGFVGVTYEYIVQVCGIVMICHLLWRVETLSDLSIRQPLAVNEETVTIEEQKNPDEMEVLLQKHCIDAQLYLQHDLTVSQLAQAIGTNRLYLGQYFARKNTTYNTYINNLRIQHFVGLYQEAVVTKRSFTAQQLASDSGYSTFSLAFKQRMGQTVTAWMRELAES